jgi:hypothetical protein
MLAGVLHTLTGPDHLAALAPLTIGRSRAQSTLLGGLWGCGHNTGQILFGMVFLVRARLLHPALCAWRRVRVTCRVRYALQCFGWACWHDVRLV